MVSAMAKGILRPDRNIERHMKIVPLLTGAAVLAAGIAAWVATRPAPQAPAPAPAAAMPGEAMVQVTPPGGLAPEEQIGKRAFDAVCAQCHGPNAAGRESMGPPLVHDYYKPSHHADMAFVMAVQNGVRAHHWTFGDMPAQSGLTGADVKAIIAYVRAVQRANGIE